MAKHILRLSAIEYDDATNEIYFILEKSELSMPKYAGVRDDLIVYHPAIIKLGPMKVTKMPELPMKAVWIDPQTYAAFTSNWNGLVWSAPTPF